MFKMCALCLYPLVLTGTKILLETTISNCLRLCVLLTKIKVNNKCWNIYYIVFEWVHVCQNELLQAVAKRNNLERLPKELTRRMYHLLERGDLRWLQPLLTDVALPVALSL